MDINTQIRHLKMAITRYGLRVTGCGFTGRGLKKFDTKISSKALLPRNSQRATRNEFHHPFLKSGGEFRNK